MAKAEWIGVVPASGGVGTNTSDVYGTRNRGRSSRSGVLTYKAEAEGAPDILQPVDQDGSLDFIEAEDVTIGAEGGTVIITGTSNAESVEIDPKSWITPRPETYTADGQTIQNNQPVPGDPGLTREWAFSVPFDIPVNPGNEERRYEIVLSSLMARRDVVITQAASGIIFQVSPDRIHLDSEGNAQQVTIISNVPWTVE